MDVQSDMEMMEMMETEIRGPTTAHGTLVDAANGLHRGPLCCTAARPAGVTGSTGILSPLCGAAGRGGWGCVRCLIRRLKKAASADVAA
jgi:hypothetical protein